MPVRSTNESSQTQSETMTRRAIARPYAWARRTEEASEGGASESSMDVSMSMSSDESDIVESQFAEAGSADWLLIVYRPAYPCTLVSSSSLAWPFVP